jgi:hypothetical protein
MLKKTITYTDFNGVSRTEDFYFNLMKSEIMEMEMSTSGGLEQHIRKIIAEQDSVKIIELFKELILKAYGEKSLDGKYFRKTPEIAQNFAATEAYSQLFMELSTDADKASAFVNGIVPKEIAEEAAKEANKNAGNITAMPAIPEA